MFDENTRIMIIDTETANSIDNPIVYDVGYRIFDIFGNVYEEASLINSDIFLDKSFMTSAYYAEKVPQYWRGIWEKKRELLPWKKIKDRIYRACKRHNCQIVAAHNARFDNRSLNMTQRYITTSRWRWFMPYGVEWWDTLKMARLVLKQDPAYKPWCIEHGFMTSNNQTRLTAEIIFRYITNDLEFTESHMGLEDVSIEMVIFLYCLEKMPDIDGRLWPPPDDTE